MPKKMTLWGVGPKTLLPGYFLLFGVNVLPWKLQPTALSLVNYTLLCTIGGIWIVVGIHLLIDAGRRITKAYYAGKLVTEGIYSYTRNPLYCVHIFFIMLGLNIMMDNAYPFVGIIYSLIAFQTLIPREESYLQEKFGEEFERYRRATNRLFPWPPKRGSDK